MHVATETHFPLLWFITDSRSSSLCSLNFRLKRFIDFLCTRLTPAPASEWHNSAARNTVSAEQTSHQEGSLMSLRFKEEAIALFFLADAQ